MQGQPLNSNKSHGLRDGAEVALHQAGVDSVTAATIVGELRTLADAKPNVFDLLSSIDDQVGKASTDRLQQQLVAFRRSFEVEVFEFARKPIEQLIAADAGAGWRAWLGLLAESFTRFRFPFAQRLYEISGPWNESQTSVAGKLRLAVRFMDQSRWPEAYEGIEYLAQHVGRDAGAGILHGNGDVVATIGLVAQAAVKCCNRDCASHRHNVARVDHEIDQRGLEFGDIDHDRPDVAIDVELQRHGAADTGAENVAYRFDSLGHIDRLRVDALAPRECQQLAGQRRTAPRGCFDRR